MSIKQHLKHKRFENPAEESMMSLLFAAGFLGRTLDDVCGNHGITHDQYNVLRILRGVHPKGHPRYAIAERLVSRAPDVTRLLDRLEREGLVERYRSEEDRRLSISRITDGGLELLEAIDPEILAVHERFGRGIPERDLRELARLCAAVAEEGAA